MEKLNLKDLLIEAMNSEIKAKEFYNNAAEKAQSQAGRKFFKELANFEQNHYNKIKSIIESIDKGIKIESQKYDTEIPAIKSEVEGEFEPNKEEIVDLINLAINAEKNAQERYRKISRMSTDNKVKDIFDNLANEERNHQRILENQFYHISNKGTIIWE